MVKRKRTVDSISETEFHQTDKITSNVEKKKIQYKDVKLVMVSQSSGNGKKNSRRNPGENFDFR